jgi:hypothetical protein
MTKRTIWHILFFPLVTLGIVVAYYDIVIGTQLVLPPAIKWCFLIWLLAWVIYSLYFLPEAGRQLKARGRS